ncbi:hypothetical protein [Mycobacterium sp. EPa45]|uniref:hypothetical protein n=1 Tax=Mycobacterium sp. EPa45 TaxID=1545728 RepID=UPI00064266A1|nr:hypothetical protein [Mycobacterium sp. EPa45]AKK28206.1 hypothetical protein AB431_17650 [Mycobacterium sp. EPa45]
MTTPIETDAAEGNPAESSEAWAARMQDLYGDCPDDLPDRQPGQTDTDWRTSAEDHMRTRAAAATEPPSAAADGSTDAAAGDPPQPPVADGKPEAPVDLSTAGEGADAEADSADNGDGHQDDDADQRTTNEAARYRTRLRAAEADLAEARITAEWLIAESRDMIDRTRQAVIDRELGRAGLDPALLTAAGHTTDTLLDDSGLIDHDKLTAAVESTIAQFRVDIPGRPRRPDPVGAVGRGGAPQIPGGLEQFTAAFRQR